MGDLGRSLRETFFRRSRMRRTPNQGSPAAGSPRRQAHRSALTARLVTPSQDKTAPVWSDLVPLRSADDPRLWLATPYCPSIERRIELLNVSEPTARADQEACERRTAEARAASSGR
jgi:hypothetical protein